MVKNVLNKSIDNIGVIVKNNVVKKLLKSECQHSLHMEGSSAQTRHFTERAKLAQLRDEFSQRKFVSVNKFQVLSC